MRLFRGRSNQQGAGPLQAAPSASEAPRGQAGEGPAEAPIARPAEAASAQPAEAARARPAGAASAGPARRGIGWRTRDPGAAAVGAVGSGFLVLARLVMTV